MLLLLGIIEQFLQTKPTVLISRIFKHSPRVPQSVRVDLGSCAFDADEGVVRGNGVLETLVPVVDVDAKDFAEKQ